MSGESITARYQDLFSTVCNWGRWGAGDERGTLNLITAAKRLEAAGCVRTGRTFSLAVPLGNRGPQRGNARRNPQHIMTRVGTDPDPVGSLGGGVHCTDDMVIMHLQCATQWDAFSHIIHQGQMYNGFAATEVNSTGARRNSIDKVHGDFVSRSVLLDIPRLRGLDVLAPGYAISSEELDLACERQRVSVGPGDIVLIRTGSLRSWRETGAYDQFNTETQRGLHWETAAWLHEHGVAAVAADNLMVETGTPTADTTSPLHVLALQQMGLPLGEFFWLEDLADACAQDAKWDFQLIAAALPFEHAVGSPVNPIAVI
jgi:kynurenine formamidase